MEIEAKIELEDHFILRLPTEDARAVRHQLRTKPKKLKKKMQIALDPESGAATVNVSEKTLNGRLRKLPTVIESLKTHNKTVFVKTADVCHILDCVNLAGEPHHGLAPSLKNARKKRFRKCLINRDEAAVNVQKELFYLIQADLEAVSTKFVIITKEGENKGKSEVELFGVLSDSETDSNVEEVE